MRVVRPAVLVLLTLVLVLSAEARPGAAPKARRRGRHVQLKEYDIRRSIEFQTLAEMQVRLPRPPGASNAKAKRTYTDAELRALKGNPNLPGYEGTFDNLKLRQIVKVYLSQQKSPTKVEREPGGAISTNPDDKHAWKRVGYLVGMVVKIDSDHGRVSKRSKKKLEERFSSDARDRFTIQVESLAMTTARGLRLRTGSSKQPITLGKHVFATRVVVLRDVKDPEND
ncbi:MAG TPA: hypothetical protein VFA18_06900 [Gemmataceae bacterium]|nr:hypothetical protein [Gemmataceae bacterium]